MVTAIGERQRQRRRSWWFALIVMVALGLVGGRAWAQLPSPSELRQQFQETDRNGDGRIDREEFHRRSVELFYFLDKDRKGYLMIGDVKGLAAKDFKAADRQGDGKLTLEEFINGRFGNFDLADTDGDGVLTLAEIEVYVNRRQ
ncbi:MAG: EF-hand domain-containing protein [Candidatus Rokuibacteriota bacterium]